MALPVILINSATGSDTAASGAGPATAVTGTAAATDGTNGKTVTITDAVALGGVAVDGSAALYLVDATAGHRNFDNITAISGSSGAWTVTVQNGFTISLTGKSWAIGGKRASLASSTSLRLISNNGAAGDAMPGWVVELQSAHSETISATVVCLRAGDGTNGPITLRGASGAATRPLLTFSNNGDAFNLQQSRWVFQDFEMQNSNATKTASNAFDCTTAAGYILIKNIKCSHSTNKVTQFYSAFLNATGPIILEDCEIGHTSGIGINTTSGGNWITVRNCWIYSCGAQGIYFSGGGIASEVSGCIIAFCANEGIRVPDSTSGIRINQVVGNVIHGNGGDGIAILTTVAHFSFGGGGSPLEIENNILSFNGGYGINFSGSGMNDSVVASALPRILNNNFFSNSTGKYNGMTIASSINETTTDPSGGLASSTQDFTGATGGSNFMSSANKAKGYPIGGTLAVGTGSASYTYQDIGLQHQDAGGGSGGISAARVLNGV